MEKGYRAFKAVFDPYTRYLAPLPEVDKVARMIEALRTAFCPGVDVMIDFHRRLANEIAALAHVEACTETAHVRRGAAAARRDRSLASGGAAH